MGTHLRRRLERERRRVVAEVLFFLRGLRVLVRPTLGLLVTLALGTAVERHFGAPPGGANPTWEEAAFGVWSLMLGEIGVELPESAVGQAAVYLLPLLGVLFVAEGVIKLGFTVFNKDEQSEAWMDILAHRSRQHVIVCGLGTVGYRVVEELLALGEQVFVVERKNDGEFIALAREKGAEVLVGDARTDNLLRSLNVEAARAVIVATNDDLANLEIAMDVREQHPHVPIVLRLYDQRLAQKVRTALNIQVSVSTSKLAAPLFASAALDPAVVGTHRVDDQLLVVVELAIAPASRLAGRTVGDVGREHLATVVALKRPGEGWTLQPAPEDVLQPYALAQFLVPGQRAPELRGLTTGSWPA